MLVANMERTVIVFAAVLVLIQVSVAYVPRFHNGRPRGGMVKPPVSERLSADPYPPEMWMEQRLDHFNDANTNTWQQRYFVNDTFYQPGSPVFLMIGGEGPASPAWMVEGAWIEYAKVYNAMCFQVEHRFYGKSHPTPDMSVDNLQYLSSEQALADLAAFIQFAKVEYDVKDNLWISFGVLMLRDFATIFNNMEQHVISLVLVDSVSQHPLSTGSSDDATCVTGALSAWLRMKYPHLITGSVATSAPVLAQLNFENYLGVVRDSLATTGPGCDEAIQQATTAIEKKLYCEEGRDELKKLFNLCDDIDADNKNDIANLFETLAENFAVVVQYNKELSNITIDTVCGIMTDSSMAPIERYAKANKLMTSQEKCVDFLYSKMTDDIKKTEWNSSTAGGRQWIYQTCTEFGYYQSSDLADQPFGHDFPLSFSIQQCMDIFGSTFNQYLISQGIKRTNTNYGGLGIKVTKIVLPNGSIDPWHALGIRKNLGPDAITIFINGTAHCANMMPPRDNDPPGLIAARATIQKLIGQWIQ